jgi:hypothetical protein
MGKSGVRSLAGRREVGSGKAADEDRKEEKGTQMSKGGEVDQFHEGESWIRPRRTWSHCLL